MENIVLHIKTNAIWGCVYLATFVFLLSCSLRRKGGVDRYIVTLTSSICAVKGICLIIIACFYIGLITKVNDITEQYYNITIVYYIMSFIVASLLIAIFAMLLIKLKRNNI